MPARRPSAKQLQAMKVRDENKRVDDYRTLNYPTNVVKAIGIERDNFADKLMDRNASKKAGSANRALKASFIKQGRPDLAGKVKSKKKKKVCAPGDLYNKHMKKKNKLFGKKSMPLNTPSRMPAKKPSAPAQFKGRMNTMKAMINDL